MTCTSPNAPTITFAGFRSRWMTLRAWAYATAWHTCSNIGHEPAAVRRVRPPSRSARVSPLISFIARNGRPSGQRAEVVDGRDGRVLELAGDAGLVEEPPGGRGWSG